MLLAMEIKYLNTSVHNSICGCVKVWDDVVRKEKPKEEAFEYKKRLTLDHEKSKLSLAEVYEQEYIKLNQVNFSQHQLLH